jgi:predicted nucleic acid-binding protein
MAFLLDTNVLSELRKADRCNPRVRQWFAALEADDLYLSVLVVGEIRRGIELLRRRDGRGAAALDRWLSELERRYADHILPVTLEICRIWGGMSLERPLAPIDGLLAATAVYHGMTLVTRNIEDVERSGAVVLDPFAPA